MGGGGGGGGEMQLSLERESSGLPNKYITRNFIYLLYFIEHTVEEGKGTGKLGPLVELLLSFCFKKEKKSQRNNTPSFW